MILLITPSSRGQECAIALEQATGQPATSAQDFHIGTKLLRSSEYQAIALDESLVHSDPDSADVLLQHAGTAFPVYVNFGISNMERLVRELRQALQRNIRERQLAQQHAELELRNHLKDTITALLLSCELALSESSSPSPRAKLESIFELAKELRSRAGIELSPT
jgi:hypothetical protein